MRSRPGLGLGIFCILWVLSGCQVTPDRVWERAEAGLPRQAVILALIADPGDPNRLWAGYYLPGGLAASRDGGQTWIIGAQGLGDNPIFDLLLLPDDYLLAGTRDGLLGSTDGVNSWKLIAAEGLPSATVFALAADASGQVYVGFDDAGPYLGNPKKDLWEPLARDEPLSTSAVLSLAVSPDGKHLYAGTAGHGLYASQDAGQTWIAAFPDDYVPNIALDPSRPMTAVASLRDRLARTRDGGLSWETLPVGWARDEAVSLLWQKAPITQSLSGEDVTGPLFAGSGKGQVYCSQNGGDTWEEIGVRLPTQGGILALATAGDRIVAGTWTGIYAITLAKTETSGTGQTSGESCGIASQTWEYLSPTLGIPNANALLAADKGLLLGTRAGLFRWQPMARRWAKVPLRHSPSQDSLPGGVTTLATAPPDGQVAYAGAASGTLYRSDDGGGRWARVSSDLEIGIRALAVAPEDADHIYMLAAWERMYESDDGGQIWHARWTGLDVTTEATSLVLDPTNPSIIFVGTDAGLYRSHYGGEDWRPVGHRLDGQTVLTLATHPTPDAGEGRSVLYIGATRGAYRSYDGGDTVERWGQGLEEISVTTILFDPMNPQTVYAGTAYAGLYWSDDGGETWQPTRPSGLADEVVEALSWGPSGELFVASAGGVWMGSKE
jgi:photosystem II stability/assembly factor-like uncharacterized protein